MISDASWGCRWFIQLGEFLSHSATWLIEIWEILIDFVWILWNPLTLGKLLRIAHVCMIQWNVINMWMALNIFLVRFWNETVYCWYSSLLCSFSSMWDPHQEIGSSPFYDRPIRKETSHYLSGCLIFDMTFPRLWDLWSQLKCTTFGTSKVEGLNAKSMVILFGSCWESSLPGSCCSFRFHLKLQSVSSFESAGDARAIACSRGSCHEEFGARGLMMLLLEKSEKKAKQLRLVIGLSHNLEGFMVTSQVVSRISEMSTVLYS